MSLVEVVDVAEEVHVPVQLREELDRVEPEQTVAPPLSEYPIHLIANVVPDRLQPRRHGGIVPERSHVHHLEVRIVLLQLDR